MVLDPARRTVSANGVELAVFEGGDAAAATVVFVHGWPDTHHLWLGVMDLLAEDFHVVAYDLRGHGSSSDPGSVEAFRLPVLAEDLHAVIDAVSPDAPVHLVGHDWGSVTAWEAVCEPWAASRILSYTSISGPNADHLSRWLREAPFHPARLPHVARQALASAYMPFFASPLAPPVFRRLADRDRWRAFLRRTERFDPPEWGHGPTLADDMVSGLRLYRANLGRGAQARERRTAVPVLQLVATRDPAIRPATLDSSRPWAARLERVEVPYGHFVPMSHPDVVASEVARFARSVGDAGR